jgi:hypothetical protein
MCSVQSGRSWARSVGEYSIGGLEDINMRQDPRMLKPYIRLGHPSMKGFNTDTIAVRGKVGSRCLPAEISKQSINWRRINAEINRHNYAEARFVPVPLLVRPNGRRSVPLKFKSK